MRVLHDLGVEPVGRPAPTDGSVLAGGRLEVLPGGPAALVRTGVVPNRLKPRLALVLLALQRGRAAAGRAQDSAAEWIRGIAGRPELQGVLRGLTRVATYAGDLDALSADAASAQLTTAVRDGVLYLDGGWTQLIDGVAAAGERAGMVVRAGTAVQAVTALDGPGHLVTTADGALRARAVVVAVGAPGAASRLLGIDDPWVAALGPAATAACLELAVRRPPRTRFVMGVEEPLYLSVHAPPADLAPPGVQVVHLARYGARTSELDRAQLWDLAHRAGIAEADVVAHRFLHRMVVSPGMPTPGPGLAGRPGIEVPGRAGAFVAGDWVGGEGLLADASFASGALAGAAAARIAASGRVLEGAG
jgi:phytoene dehydrogenase-like protein